MSRRMTTARRAVMLMGPLLLQACVPSDRAKDLVIVNECGQVVWVRGSEVGQIEPSALSTQRPEAVGANSRLKSLAFDNDSDGISVAISRSADEVGKVVHLPHSDSDTVSFVVTPDQCP